MHKEWSFFRCASMYMDGRWNYNHKHFQRMIDRDSRINAEVVGCIITRMSELNKDDSSRDGGSMPSLQDQDQNNWSSNNDTDSYGDFGMYDDGEWWGYKARALKQIISRTHGDVFLASDTPTLYVFSLNGYTKVNMNSVLDNRAMDFC